jgi:hypothetical protein
MKPTKLLSLLTVALLAACGGDDDGETTNNTTNSTTVTTAGTEDSGSSSAGTTITTTTSPGESSTSPGESSTEPGTEDTTPDTSTGTGGGDVCMIEMDDDACATCTKTNCCDQLDACYADPDCQCTVLCVQQFLMDNPDGDTNAGLMYCTMDNEDGPAPCMLPASAAGLAIALNGCVSGMCADDC